jgi:hypothetical protein
VLLGLTPGERIAISVPDNPQGTLTQLHENSPFRKFGTRIFGRLWNWVPRQRFGYWPYSCATARPGFAIHFG